MNYLALANIEGEMGDGSGRPIPTVRRSRSAKSWTWQCVMSALTKADWPRHTSLWETCSTLRGTVLAQTKSYLQAIAISHKLVESRPDTLEYQDDLARGYLGLGNVRKDSGDREAASEFYRRSIAIGVKLLETQPAAHNYQNLARSYSGLGSLRYSTNDRKGATESYRQAIAIGEKLVKAHPNVPEYRDGLAGYFERLGEIQNAMGDSNGAVESFRHAVGIRSKLVAEQHKTAGDQKSLAKSYSRLGTAQHYSKDFHGAAESARQAVAIQAKLVVSSPKDFESRSDLGFSLGDLGWALNKLGQLREAEQAFREAVTHQRVAVDGSTQVVTYRQFLQNHYDGLTHTLLAGGRAAEAAETVRKWRAVSTKNPTDLYNTACHLALCVPIVGDSPQRQSLAAEAVATLRSAIEAGWRDAAHTSHDPDLAPLRQRDDFRQLLAGMFDRGFPSDPFVRHDQPEGQSAKVPKGEK